MTVESVIKRVDERGVIITYRIFTRALNEYTL